MLKTNIRLWLPDEAFKGRVKPLDDAGARYGDSDIVQGFSVVLRKNHARDVFGAAQRVQSSLIRSELFIPEIKVAVFIAPEGAPLKVFQVALAANEVEVIFHGFLMHGFCVT
ncbi:MAG: hypothetical protein D6763_01250 [Alphaproteobacteria bacterium]|nr:MAG: hypothetical protein D6763_01250 [Alphaproteobacteria bacterium]